MTYLLDLVVLLALSTVVQNVNAATDFGGMLEKARQIEPWLVSTRRLLHQYPELLFQVKV
jgi:hypothetical protein